MQYTIKVKVTPMEMYQVNADRTEELDAVRAIEPARVLAEIQTERETRKRLQQG